MPDLKKAIPVEWEEEFFHINYTEEIPAGVGLWIETVVVKERPRAVVMIQDGRIVDMCISAIRTCEGKIRRRELYVFNEVEVAEVPGKEAVYAPV